RDLLKRFRQIETLKEYFAWIEECDEFIKRLEKNIIKKKQYRVIDRYRVLLFHMVSCLSVCLSTHICDKFLRTQEKSCHLYFIKKRERLDSKPHCCLHYFHSNERLQSHTVDCQRINDCAIRLPSDDDNIGYYVRCSYNDSLSKYRFRHDQDCVSWFVEKLRSLAHHVK
ncbi:hypothetical protein ALC56_02297, partial [Trachymyrmex septentrionalis]